MPAFRSFTPKVQENDNLIEKNASISSRFMLPLNKWMSSKRKVKVNESSSSRPSFSQNTGDNSSTNRFMNFRSCPNSIMSSPSHGLNKDRGIFERDCAINAAIDHCKLSFHGGNFSERWEMRDEWIFLHFLQNKHALLLSKFSFGIDLISMLKTAKQVFVRDKLVEYNFKRPFLWTDSCIQFKICWRISISYFLLLCSFLKFAGLKYMDWTKNSFHKWLIQ